MLTGTLNWWLRADPYPPAEVKPAITYSGTYAPSEPVDLHERFGLPPLTPWQELWLLDWETGGPMARAAWEAVEAERQEWLASLPRHGPPTREEWEALERLDWEPVGDTGGIIYSINLDDL